VELLERERKRKKREKEIVLGYIHGLLIIHSNDQEREQQIKNKI
jgi:hypothetical protein